MRIYMRGTDDSMRIFEATLEDGTCVGIADKNHEVIIESQDLTKTVVIYATVAELERAINWCKEHRNG